MSKIEESYSPTGPVLGRVAVIAVTTSSASVDLSADTAVGRDVVNGRYIRLIADGCNVYYAWGPDGTGSIDETATSGATRCGVIPDGQYRDEVIPFVAGKQQTFLYVKGSGTGKLRVHASSVDDLARMVYGG